MEGSSVKLGDFVLLDDLFKLRAADPVQVPLIGIPNPQASANDFELLTGKDINDFVNRAAKYYEESNLCVSSTRTVAVIGPSDLDWIVSVFGLVRAGYTVLTLSPRLSPPAILKLLDETQCHCLLYNGVSYLNMVVDAVSAQGTIQSLPILNRGGYESVENVEHFPSKDVNRSEEQNKVVVVMHSSGSTGLPKPIYTTNKRYTIPSLPAPGTKDMITLPLYHAFAFTVSVQKMYRRRTIFYPNPYLALTCESLTLAIDGARPSILNAVPYILKLLAEEQQGIEAMKSCEQVISAGSQCPDELGDRIVDHGINLGTYFASTETALLGTSLDRPQGDNAWAYIRPSPGLLRHIWPKPLGEGLFEFVYLKEYPSLVTSNSAEPPGSFHSKDIFSPHPNIKDAWKHAGRIDDRITLINGEKVLPLSMEGRVQEHPLVKTAVVFGISKPIPGLLVFRADAANSIPDDEFITIIQPTIEAANSAAEGFAKIGHDMIVPMAAGVEIPMTDKRSIIRAQIYQKFALEITNAYDKADKIQENGLRLDLPALEQYLLSATESVIGVRLSNTNVDFFRAGIDSLQAIQLRTKICKDLYLGSNGKKISHNVVFETGTVKTLARYLYGLSHDEDIEEEDQVKVMTQMVEKYSQFKERTPDSNIGLELRPSVLLTGATGSVGAHVLRHLLNHDGVARIFCLIRGEDPISRLRMSMERKGLSAPDPSKVTVLTSDLSHPDFGLRTEDYHDITSLITHIVHCAWPVNFQLGIRSFEPHIAGVCNLVNLSLAVRTAQPARFIFCSSITSAMGRLAPARITEAPITDLAFSSSLGYGRSKLVAEHVIQRAVETAHANAIILRIGQVVGDQKHGSWSQDEMIPMIVRSGLMMSSLPSLDMKCEWLPVDTLAETVLELSGLQVPLPLEPREDAKQSDPRRISGDMKACGLGKDNSQAQGLVYNVRSPHTFSWTDDFLPTLAGLGFKFDSVPFTQWLNHLQSLQEDPKEVSNNGSAGSGSLASDPSHNPAIKLIEYLRNGFHDDSRYTVFEITEAQRRSAALRNAPMVVQSGLVGLMVKRWVSDWTMTDGRVLN